MDAIQKETIGRSGRSEVRLEDSISETKIRSHVSYRSAFSKSSRESTICEVMVKNAVKKASLHAEMSMFERQQSIAEEELRLNKQKQKLTLEVLEAEERVCSDLHFRIVGSKMDGSSGSSRRYLPRNKDHGFKPVNRIVDVNPIKVSDMDRMVDGKPQNAGRYNERLVIENNGKWNMGMETSEHENRFGKVEMEMEPFKTRRNYDGIDEGKWYSDHPDHRENFGVDEWTAPDQEVHRRSHAVRNLSGLNPRAVP